MQKAFHDINLPRQTLGKNDKHQSTKIITGVDEHDPEEKKEEPEVHFISAKWKPGPKGFQYNEPCFLEVKAEYLKKTVRAKIRGKLFGTFDNEEVDLCQEVIGFLDKENGIANMEIKKLWFVNDAHYHAWQKDKSAKSKYLIKAISHSRGDNNIDSPMLELPQIDKKEVSIVEVPDITFNSDSAIPSLDDKNSLINSIVTAILFGSDNPDKELVICGHTDSSGEFEYNYHLSELRAKAVKSLLDNDGSAWTKIAEEKSLISDYQTILKMLNDYHGWSCDPGKIDNISGPKTREALKEFQSIYNIKFKDTIEEDGLIGPETWKALHRVIIDLIHTAYKKEKHSESLPAISYCQSNNGIYPCGESFPINRNNQNYKSKSDRRVEFAFYNKKNLPKLEKPKDIKSKISETICQIYDYASTVLNIIQHAVAKPSQRNVKLTLKYPASTPHKQFVNLPSDGQSKGAELKIVVQAEGAENGDVVKWIVQASNENSKRNDHVPYFKNSSTNKKVQIKDGAAEITSSVSKGNAEILFYCGVAGGDSFTIRISCGNGNAEFTITTWRRFWYQLTHQKGLIIPPINNTIAAYNSVFAEMKKDNEKEFEEVDVDSLTRKNINTFYKEWVINPGGSDKKVAVIGSHNKDFFYKYFHKDAQYHPKTHLIICQHQWDEDDTSTRLRTEILTQRTSSEINLMKAVFFPHLKGNIIAQGTWRSLSKKGHPDFGKGGNITDNWIVVEKNRTSRQHIKIKIPDDVKVTPDNTAQIEVKFKLKAVAGPYLGESNVFQILAVFDPSDVTDFNNTLTHEIGHAFNQVPEPSNTVPGLIKHPNQYTGHGGIGSHCHTIIDGSGNESAGSLDGNGEYPTGVCVMFHAGDSSCINRFCSFCESYVKGTDFSDFQKK